MNQQKKILEIQNFTLELSFGQFWIKHEDGRYPIIMTPFDFVKLHEIEGLPFESEQYNGPDHPVHFSKAILLRSSNRYGGDLFDECGEDVTPVECWVKQLI